MLHRYLFLNKLWGKKGTWRTSTHHLLLAQKYKLAFQLNSLLPYKSRDPWPLGLRWSKNILMGRMIHGVTFFFWDGPEFKAFFLSAELPTVLCWNVTFKLHSCWIPHKESHPVEESMPIQKTSHLSGKPELGQLPLVGSTTGTQQWVVLLSPHWWGKSSKRKALMTRSPQPCRNTDTGAVFSSW